MLTTVRRVSRAPPKKRRRKLTHRTLSITEDEVLEKEFYILIELGVPA